MYLITYDLNKPGQEYKQLFAAIEGLGPSCHIVTSTWLVDSSLKPKEIASALRPYIDLTDVIFVVQVLPKYYGQLSADWSAWLQEHLPDRN